MLKTQTDILAPFEIWEVPLANGNVLKFHEPLTLTPNWMPCDDPDDELYLELDVPELNISAWGKTRDELLSSVYSDIRMNWLRFVIRNDLKLTKKQAELRIRYFNIAEEINNG